MAELITRYKLGDLDMKVTEDTVQAKGYERWVSVRYMRTNPVRINACEWYAKLVQRGIIKKETKNDKA